ncbi:unnamed protein product [Parajaminaea phylloscopi]
MLRLASAASRAADAPRRRPRPRPRTGSREGEAARRNMADQSTTSSADTPVSLAPTEDASVATLPNLPSVPAVPASSTPWTSSRPPASGSAGTSDAPALTLTVKPRKSRAAMDSVQAQQQQQQQQHRGPNSQVNYKIKFQKSRERYHRVLAESQTLHMGLRDVQRKEAKLQREIDWLLDAIADKRPDLVDAVLLEDEEQERYREQQQQQQQREAQEKTRLRSILNAES